MTYKNACVRAHTHTHTHTHMYITVGIAGTNTYEPSSKMVFCTIP